MEMSRQRDVRHFRYDATGLCGKRMRLTDDLPTSDAGHVQEALIGVTDVVRLDDTPNVMHDLHVYPIDRPDVVAYVEFRQLAVYNDQEARSPRGRRLAGLI